ncbi:hypothetical protein GCM10010329_40810 [Streptomyces spiroverticillatus]|uniref:Uncharacterized protein n=1 Tax=Streptomyces finlayi TaxID=67296 RepID=A0A918WZ31_9ACTN|nr:hypothetical protein [Streptomyces finlayi]GHA13793.1 hypothetical protein GCM10010329_40810 [Streptomyces spiroverticillatus]GHC97743.1 hypothetical protein GCM10010334_39430 [Streptomyces finlayi]
MSLAAVEFAGKFVDFTGVLWKDIVLNVSFIFGMLGVLVWIAWWVQERRRGVRGAAENPPLTLGRRMVTRRVLGVLSVAGTLALLGFGIALATGDDPEGNAGFLLVLGGLFAVAWLVALVLGRPLPRPADDRSVKHAPTREKPYDQTSYAHLPDDVPGRKRNS